MMEFNPGPISLLDRTRLTGGINGLKAYFQALAKLNPDEAARTLNEVNLQFCTLFLLQPEIENFKLYGRLSPRNRQALELIHAIAERHAQGPHKVSLVGNNLPYTVLKWVLHTGCGDDGFYNRYDEIMELTAILLVKVHKDYSILPLITDMMFNRHRKGLFYYHLVWAFLESRDPDSLSLIAGRLFSPHPKDVELVIKLLGFVPGFKRPEDIDPMALYCHFLNWFQENRPFLHYTGENLQESCNPAPYAVSLEARYLCKPVSPADGKLESTASEDERGLLESFRKLSGDVREQLSSYSFLLHGRSPEAWAEWRRRPVTEQMRMSGLRAEGL